MSLIFGGLWGFIAIVVMVSWYKKGVLVFWALACPSAFLIGLAFCAIAFVLYGLWCQHLFVKELPDDVVRARRSAL
jgi:hypothetical protein